VDVKEKVSPGGATRCANLVHGGRRHRGRGALRSLAIAPGRRAQKWHILRTTRRCQVKIITLKSQCFSRKNIALMGFARNQRMPPFDRKPVGTSAAYSGARMEIMPRIANPSRTRMPMRVSNQVFDGNASASLPRASGRSGVSHSRRVRLTPPPQPPACPTPSHPAPAATARGTSR
jgi:hypothetical protein